MNRHESIAAQWLMHLTSEGKVIVSVPVRNSDFFSLSHGHDTMNITSFSFSLPSFFFVYNALK